MRLFPWQHTAASAQRNTMEAYIQRVLQERRWEVEVEYSRSSVGKPVKNLSPLADLIIERFPCCLCVCCATLSLSLFLLSLSLSCEGARVNGKLDGFCRAVFKDGHFYEVPQIKPRNSIFSTARKLTIFLCVSVYCVVRLLLCAGRVQ